MASPREVRRLAFQALFQLDARLEQAAPLPTRTGIAARKVPTGPASGGGAGSAGAASGGALSAEDAAAVRDSLMENEDFSVKERENAFRLALDAFNARHTADATFRELAPAWPAHRQPAVDRAILRLAHYEITSLSTLAGGKVSPKVAVSEAVELAKSFGGEKSPGFVNALLDKVLKQLRAAAEPAAPATDAPASPDPTDPPPADPASQPPQEER